MSIEFKPSLPVIDTGHPLARGLVAAYPFFEGVGDARLIELHGNHGTFVSGPAWEVSHPYGHGLRFNGSTDAVSMPQIMDGAETEITLALLCKADNNSTQMLPFTYDNDGHFFFVRLNDAVNDEISWEVYDGGSAITTETTSFSTTEWRWIVGRAVENGNIELFVDGLSQGTSAFTTFATSASPGRHIASNRDASNNFFNGLISDVRIWNRALSVPEIEGISRDPWSLYAPKVRQHILTDEATTPLGEVSEVGQIDGVLEVAASSTLESQEVGDVQMLLELTSTVTEDFRSVTFDTGAIGMVMEVNSPVTSELTISVEGEIDIVVEVGSPVSLESQDEGQIDGVLEVSSDVSEGTITDPEPDLGDAIIKTVPRIDYIATVPRGRMS